MFIRYAAARCRQALVAVRNNENAKRAGDHERIVPPGANRPDGESEEERKRRESRAATIVGDGGRCFVAHK